MCSKGGNGNPNCIPKSFTTCEGDYVFTNPATGACECIAACPADDPNFCGDDGCGSPCNPCGDGYVCDAFSEQCLLDENLVDAGHNDNGSTPTVDAGSSEACVADTDCPDTLADECVAIPDDTNPDEPDGTDEMYSVTIDVGTCNLDGECEHGEQWELLTCTSCPADASPGALTAAGCEL